MPQFCGIVVLLFAEDAALIARGEHRIEIQRYGRENPEVSIDILQSEYYNENHDEFVVRIEDLNKTLNRQINEDAAREYNKWFEDEFNRRFAQYTRQPREESLSDNGTEPEAESEGEAESQTGE